MMPHVDNHLIGKSKKMQKMSLTLVLDEGDKIINSIREGMEQNKIPAVSVSDITGELKSGEITFKEGDILKSKKLKNIEIIKSSGTVRLSYGEEFGGIKISVIYNRKPLTGVLSKGIAAKGMAIKLIFYK